MSTGLREFDGLRGQAVNPFLPQDVYVADGEVQWVKELAWEVRRLRGADEILRRASAYLRSVECKRW